MEKVIVTLKAVYKFDAEELRTRLIEQGMSNIQPADIKEEAFDAAFDLYEFDDLEGEVVFINYDNDKEITIAWAHNTWIDLIHEANVGTADELIQYVNQHLYKVNNEDTFTRSNEFWYNKIRSKK